MDNVEGILEKLFEGDFDSILGAVESSWLEAKGGPYILQNDRQKLELAKDVTALANSNGGIILIGFETVRDLNAAGERVGVVKTFPLSMLDADHGTTTLVIPLGFHPSRMA